MKFERIYIEDFGIIRNQVLEELSPNINIIGGYNRAGKTTFMKLLKSFGYGISKGDDVPPANALYRATADIIHGREKNKILISGYGKPRLTEGQLAQVSSIYKVDSFTYSRLFTIDLEELKKVSKDEDKLSYVLLGGGFKEIVKIPSILNEIEKDGEKIGGKSGNPNVKEFKPYYEEIKKQLKVIEESGGKIKEYEEKKEKLQKLIEEEENLKSVIKTKEDKIILLKTLKVNYEIYKEIKELEEKLENGKELIKSMEGEDIKDGINCKNSYLSLKEKFNSIKETKERMLGTDKNILEKLLSKKEEIINLNLNISGLKNKISNYEKNKVELKKEEERINQDIIELDVDLLNHKDLIKKIKGDSLSISKIDNLIEDYSNCIKEIEDLNNSLCLLKNEKEAYENISKVDKNPQEDKSYFKYMLANAIILILGSLVFIYNKQFGSIIAITGVITSAIYMYSSIKTKEKRRKENEIANEKYIAVNGKINDINIKKKEKQIDYEYLVNEINRVKSFLKIKKEAPISYIKTYYIKVNEINKNIYKYDMAFVEQNSTRKEIEDEINKIGQIVGEILGVKIDVDLDNTDELFKRLSFLSDSILVGEEYKDSEERYKKFQERLREQLKINSENIIEEIDKYIIKTENYKKLLESNKELISLKKRLKTGFDGIEEIDKLYSEYNGVEEIKTDYLRLADEVLADKKASYSIKDEKAKIKYQIEDLDSFNKIEEAKINIYNQKQSLETLAKTFGAYRAAAFILKDIQSSFMEETKDKLLKGGSVVFNELTNGEYKKIQPNDNILSSDFKVIDKEGATIETSRYLSKATSEQLFLSVRLSKIQEMEEKLPVIFDDSFVSFDSINVKRALMKLKEISKENQIFILTCHSKLIDYISQITDKASYFYLNEGKFRKTDSLKLIDYLENK